MPFLFTQNIGLIRQSTEGYWKLTFQLKNAGNIQIFKNFGVLIHFLLVLPFLLSLLKEFLATCTM